VVMARIREGGRETPSLQVFSRPPSRALPPPSSFLTSPESKARRRRGAGENLRTDSSRRGKPVSEGVGERERNAWFIEGGFWADKNVCPTQITADGSTWHSPLTPALFYEDPSRVKRF